MVFNSDLKFSKEISYYIKECSDYFADAKLQQENYDIYAFGAYLGMVLRKSQVEKNEKEDFSKEPTKQIPRLILTNNEYNFKELCVCSVYSAAKGRMNKDDLQRVWNVRNYTDVVELSFDDKYEIMKNLNIQAELGLRFLCQQIQNEFKSDIVDIVEKTNYLVKERFETSVDSSVDESAEELIDNISEDDLTNEEISLLEKIQNLPNLEKLLDKRLFDKVKKK